MATGRFGGCHTGGRQVDRRQSFETFFYGQGGHAAYINTMPDTNQAQKAAPQDSKPAVGVDEDATPVEHSADMRVNIRRGTLAGGTTPFMRA